MAESNIVNACNRQWPRGDILAALGALSDAGALTSARGVGSGRTATYSGTTSLRRTIDDAVAVAALLPALRRQFDKERQPTLVVSWPTAVRGPRFVRWRSSRITLVEMIDEAHTSLALVFPFVDAAGTQEVALAIERALARAVNVVLLTRYLANDESPNAQLASRLLRAPHGKERFRAINISSDGDPRRELLHAKVLVADGGRRAYIGSANLTGTAFGESIEIGIAVEGAVAESVAELVDDLLTWGLAE